MLHSKRQVRLICYFVKLPYTFDKSEPEKGAIDNRLIRDYDSEGNLVLSTQVLQEF